MAITSREIDKKSEWESFIATHLEANFLHSWGWGEFLQNIGHKVTRMGFFNQDKLVGALQFIVEDARRGRYGVVPGGPIIDWSDRKLVGTVFAKIRQLGDQNKCVFVRVRPQLLSDSKEASYFKEFGFKSAPMHLHAELTWQLDLTQTEDEILAGMRKNTRYEVRQAQKKGIVVKRSQDPVLIDRFYQIQLETAERHGFVPFSKEYLKEQFKVFAASDNVVLFEAFIDDKLLSQAYIIFYGEEAAYHFGTSTDANRNLPGAYALQWEAIKEAKKRGMSRYNFWGVTKHDETQHRFYGVSVFKRGFGGDEVSYLHAQDLVINKGRYLINSLVEHVRKRIRHV